MEPVRRWRIDVNARMSSEVSKWDLPRDKSGLRPEPVLLVIGSVAFKTEQKALAFYKKMSGIVGSERISVWTIKSDSEGNIWEKDWVELYWGSM